MSTPPEHTSNRETPEGRTSLFDKLQLKKDQLEEEMSSMEEGAGVTLYRMAHHAGRIAEVNDLLKLIK